jgi:Fanconi anemia group M protein
MPMHNIFKQTKRKLKLKKQKTPKIIADIHEKNSLIISELHKSTQIRLEIKPLKIADYLIGNTAIERKTVSDFISSMINKRLIQQLRQLQTYPKKLLIIEGQLSSIFEKDARLNPNAIRGFILSIISNYNTPIIFTQDYEDTSKYLITLAKQQVKPSVEPSLHSKIPKKKRELKQYIIEAFPNIGPVKAKKLLKKFKTLQNIFNASEEDLKEILKNQSKNFKNLLEE